MMIKRVKFCHKSDIQINYKLEHFSKTLKTGKLVYDKVTYKLSRKRH